MSGPVDRGTGAGGGGGSAGGPNVVFILSDDQGAWAMGCAGNTELRTPALDQLAAEGMRFSNFFCASPVCSPARATLLTGRIPSQHGVHDWLRRGNVDDPDGVRGPTSRRGVDRPIEYLAGMRGYTDVLAERGWTCGLSGKWHLGASATPQKGFTSWFAHGFGGGPYYGAALIRDGQLYAEPRYVTDVITDQALAFLDTQRQATAPFYLSVHYTAPHSPWDRGNHPAELYDRYLNECAFASVPDVPLHPWQVDSAPHGTGERRRAALAGYFAAVEAMDRGVGQILERLRDMGVREQTLVVFTSDNGMNMGHHGIWGKGNGTLPLNMYDTSVKVPLLVAQPGVVPTGVDNDTLLSQYDFKPTLLELLGLGEDEQDTAQLPGRSFAAVLRGEAPAADRDYLVVYDEYGPVRMIRTRQWKYIHRHPYGPHELYHLERDADEERNLLAPGGEYDAAVRVELKGQLDRWFARYVDPARDGTREGVTGAGQLDLAGPAGGGREAFAADRTYADGTAATRPRT